MPDSSRPIDVAIIGAGVSGAYSAYRLTRDTKKSVEVFEANKRVGGRLFSHQWDEADTMVELGGEAFSPAHAHVAGIVRELRLKTIPHKPFNTQDRLFLRNRLMKPEALKDLKSFPGKGGDRALPEVRYFVGDDYFPKNGKVTDPFETVANHLLTVISPEVGQAFGALMTCYGKRIKELTSDTGGELTPENALKVVNEEIFNAIGAVIHAMENAKVQVPQAFKDEFGTSSVRAYELDFWSMVIGVLGQEAYELFRNAGYDNTSALSFNFVELMENLLLGALMGMASPGFWSLEGGFDQLPKTLLDEAQRAGAKRHMQMRLVRIRRRRDLKLTELAFEDARGRTHIKYAHSVVMSAPVCCFDGSVELEGFDPGMTQNFADRRKGIAKIPAGKLYMVYPEPWWQHMKDLGSNDPMNGYASTDMPSRAIYYKGAIKGGKGLINGALTDSINVDYWTSFLSPNAEMFRGVPLDQQKEFGAPKRMVAACHRILKVIHQDNLPSEMPLPELALYHEWRVEGAGWSAWKSGRDIHNDARHLRLPFTQGHIDQALYCCGDSVAERHGWVENTIESAELMLREAYGLDAASWLPSKAGF
ncbi:flavin monoamine oxidase family protein [Primorskyibacter sp. S87]|uniref:flavin monoamine oxidase family protein n=1 Tax=Primorskyibacter sp. S87 TaxID=3415126 RepID=UPI003C7D3F94